MSATFFLPDKGGSSISAHPPHPALESCCTYYVNPRFTHLNLGASTPSMDRGSPFVFNREDVPRQAGSRLSSQTLGIMYQCPHCTAPLKRWAVLTSGSFNSKSCPACNGKYFAGGLPGFMAILCASFLAAVVLAAFSSSPGAVHIAIYVSAFFVGGWHMVRCRPRPISQRWSQTALTLAPIPAMALLIQAIGYWR